MATTDQQVNTLEHWLTVDDGTEIFVREWSPREGPTRAILQIAHGMAEHGGRYDAFGAWLTRRGIAVVAGDHRGHGRTGEKAGRMGWFGDFPGGEGFDRVTEDLRFIALWSLERHPEAPLFMLGHSMGSMLVRRFIQQLEIGPEPAGAIIVGTAGNPGALGALGRFVARVEMRRRGPTAPSSLLSQLTFGGYNKRIADPKTFYDWLSRDEAEVAKYVADPFCGFIPTAAFFLDLLTGLQRIHDDGLVARIPKNLPLLFVSGEADPVGDYGRGVEQVVAQYERHGLSRIQSRMYPGARHEPLNETNREEVYDDIFTWLEARLAEKAPPADSADAS